MLHGWGDCGRSFQFLVDELKQEWFVIAPDWRGFGKTGSRANSYWFPDYVADLDVLLARYQPQEPVNLLGHSMGANVIGLYAGIMPERVAAFVNVEGFGLKDSDPQDAPANYRRWIEKSRVMPKYASYATFEELAQWIRKRNPSVSPDKAMFVAKQWAEQVDDGTVTLRADPAHKLPNAVLYRRAEALACWSKITAPVLQVVGEDTDFTVAAKSWIETAAGAAPPNGAETIVIPDAGHMVHFEQPGRLAAVIEAFFQESSQAVV
ncbi:MAG: alpha/beta hydrolase [Gammaproteobacteria bacterium]|nr:MAG: alpha/beta hydrolase [Gammaproteobacteria bacterium]